MQKEKNEVVEKANNQSTIFNNLYVKIAIAVVLIVIAVIGLSIYKSKEGKITIITKTELVSVVKKNNLNTAEYVYNGIAEKKNNKGEKVYYVNYKGTVVAGTKLDDLEIIQDDENKKIIVKIPEIKITENKVDSQSLDIIFLDKSYDTETVHAEAYTLSKKDLESKAKENKTFIDKAQEKADSIIRALIQPLIETQDKEYELVIERGE